jgi:tetratricopeptide (TPR) repeat protein
LREAASEPGYIFANALGRLTEAGRKSGLLLAFEVAKAILIIDQVEELFTIAGINPDDRRLFIQLLAGLARSGAVWVIVTLRADFWHRAAEIPELVALAEGPGRIDLAAASPAEIAEMIRKPAQAAGYSFEVHPQTGLGLDAVLAEHAAAAPGALPLLSFTLDELYKNAKTRGATVLTYASYEALGGLEGAIASRADEIVGGLPVSAQAALPRVLRAVTTVTGIADHVPVARSVPLDSFGEGSPARMLVDAFIAARLLVAASDSGAPPTVRLAHEALISRWKRARDQLAGDRRDLETRTLVERQFGRWSHARGRARRLLLLRNPDLASAVDLARRWSEELDAPTRDFIKRSARRARLARTFTAAAVFMLVIGVLAGWQWQIARAQRDRAESALTAAAGTADRLAFDLGVKLRNAPGVADDVVIDVVGRVLNLQMQLAPVGGTQPQLRRLEAAALGEMSNTLSSRGAISSARNAAERAVATMEDLVQLDPTNAQYQRDLAVNLNQLSDVHLRSGDYSAALDLSQRALSVVKKLLAAAPDDANLQDDLAASLTRIGAVLAVTGKVAEALDTFQQTLAFLEQLVAKQPDNLPWQFSLSSAHNRVGLILLQMGQTAAALEAFQAGLVIRQKLVEADPKNAEFQRGLFDSYTRKGDTVARTGAWQEALSAYQDALTIIKKLVATDPGNEQWQNELATAYDKVGQLQMLGKASDQALDSFRNSAAIREQLVASVNIDRERAIEVSYNKIADILIATGKRAEAVRSYQDALAIAQRLLSAAPPERTEWLNDLAFCYVKLGTVYATDNRAQAHDFYQKAIAIREQLVASDKTDVRFQRGLALTYEALASLAVGEKSNAEAAASLRKAVALREQIATSDSDNAMWQFDLALSLFWLAQVGDDPQTHYQQALAIVQKLDDAGKLTADQKALIVAIQQAQAALPAHK